MLTQLPALKSRLQILDTDTTYDSLLTTAIQAMSARFDKETNRTLARTENASHLLLKKCLSTFAFTCD